ncbi:hypothetical protein [uncultured Flavobacterium sp.]|uniref:hypothetical protein n=1 Tax=uncultured Flavobacterium sp. TaxID=165435 RepID=UPI0025E04E4F|nr:hypothetical protein [uncultured Flavobacterium sp.]
MENKKLPFLETIYHLRTIEQIILYDKVMKVSAQEEKETIDFLQDEYEREELDYPFQAPIFEEKASLWASKIVYFASQFLLNRENTNKDLDEFLPKYNGQITVSTHLSADLCLRFLPQVLQEFKRIDADDIIIPILENHLKTFHYSAIGFENSVENIDFKLFENDCFKQLYLNRITERKDIELSKIPEINVMLQRNFGDYQKVFWKNFENINE